MLAFAEVGQQVSIDSGWRCRGAQPAQGRIGGDAVQPGAKLARSLNWPIPLNADRKASWTASWASSSFPRDAPGDEQQPAAVGANARFKGVVVTGLHPRQQGRFVKVRGGVAG